MYITINVLCLLLIVLSQSIHSTLAMTVAPPSSPPSMSHFVGFDLGTSGARISIIHIEPHTTNDNEHTNDNIKSMSTSTSYNEVHNDSIQYATYDDPNAWTDAIHSLLQKTPSHLLQSTKAICVSGTSASCLLVDQYTGKVTRSPKMYDYDITHSTTSKPNNDVDVDDDDANPMAHIQAQELIDQYVPKEHATRAPTSALSKLLHYHYCKSIQGREVLAHQSEYVANTIFLSNPTKCGAGNKVNKRTYVSDWHNALKLGYDVKELCYPVWLMDILTHIGINDDFNDDDGNESVSVSVSVLPKVVAPGEVIHKISSTISDKYGIHPDAVVVGGTTDSNAAFVAATAADGIPTYGTAVTSLGSTLAIKMLSRSYVENASQGVYSHRFPVFSNQKGETNDDDGNDNDNNDNDDDKEEAWLVGGASNVGCAILRKENFSNEELITLSNEMDVMHNSPLTYYPLTKQGERFPIADGMKQPLLTPKPDSRLEYLKGILQGISFVEKQAFEVLGELGSNPSFPNVVWTCGGGSKNDKWIQMRQRILEEAGGLSEGHNDGGNDDGNELANVKVMKATNSEASYGAAVLAASSFS